MNFQVPTLERFVGDDEIKDLTESTQLLTASQQEFAKPKQQEKKEDKKIIKQNDNLIINNEIKESNLNNLNDKMKEEGRIKNRRETTFFSVSPNFFQQYGVMEIPNMNSNKYNKIKLDDFSINNDENKDLENLENMFGYQKEETNPVLLGLYKKLEDLQKKRKEIDTQFKYEKDLYEKRLETLNNAWNTRVDRNKLNELEKINKQNKETLKELKLKVDEAEKDKIKDRQKFNEAMNYVLELKSRLIKELRELEIMAKTTSFEDYDEYMNNDPIKIEKTNFRPNDSRYLLTNEYETSRDDEESISSYDKLNNINNTPEGFEINRQKNIYLNYTNTKTSKIHPATYNDNIINEKNNNLHNNTYNNKITEGSFSLKPKEINSQNNTNIKIPPKNNLKNSPKIEINNQPINNMNNNDNKRVFPKDPDFINKDMILIRNLDEQESDDFY